MAHITEFTVSGLAGRSDIYHQVLDRHVNIFFGLNGSGKTSLLKILDSAMETNGKSLENVPFNTAEVKIFSKKYKKIFTYTTDKKNVTQGLKARNELAHVQESLFEITFNEEGTKSTVEWKETPKQKDPKGGWQHQYLPTSRLYLGARIIDPRVPRLGSSATEQSLDEYFAQSLQLVWRDYNSQILTSVRKAQEDGLANILKAILSGKAGTKKETGNINLQVAYERVSKFLLRQGSKDVLGSFESFKKQYEKNLQLRKVVSDIDEVERRVAESFAPRDELQSLVKQMFTGDKDVVFGENSIDLKAHGKEISLSSLSSGEKHVLRILLETLLAGENCIIIDEPELSMHIDWQKDLIKIMRQLNSKAQIIIATHSPEVMADIKDEQIFRL
jgi:predicted ATPase